MTNQTRILWLDKTGARCVVIFPTTDLASVRSAIANDGGCILSTLPSWCIDQTDLTGRGMAVTK